MHTSIGKMTLKQLFTESSFAKHHRSVKAAPREIFSRPLILSALLYAMAAVPLSTSRTLVPHETWKLT
jgi:hypothetical protein